MAKLTIRELSSYKNKRQLTVTTAHDYFTAKACEDAGIDIIVTDGDFIRQSIAGETLFRDSDFPDLKLALEGVRRGAPDTFIYAGLPNGAANVSDGEAIRAAMKAVRFGADAIYYSGIPHDKIRACADEKIAVIGHVGMIPWHASWIGGFKAVGKTADAAMKVYEDSLRMQDAGCVAIEMECVPEKVAAEISRHIEIPALSMGSGGGCDGQYLFSSDLLGRHQGHYPRHSITYVNQIEQTLDVMKQFVSDVETDRLSEKQKLITIQDQEYELFLERIS